MKQMMAILILAALTCQMAQAAGDKEFRELMVGMTRDEVIAAVGDPDKTLDSTELKTALSIYLMADSPSTYLYMIGYDDKNELSVFGQVYKKGQASVEQLKKDMTDPAVGMKILKETSAGTILISTNKDTGDKHYAFLSAGDENSGASFLVLNEETFEKVFKELFDQAYEDALKEAGMDAGDAGADAGGTPPPPPPPPAPPAEGE